MLPGVVCRLLKTGINHTYLIENNTEKFVFRVYSYNWRSQEEIEAELYLLQQLHQNGIAVSGPLTDKFGTMIQTLHAPEGPRFGVLFTFAKGRKIHQYPAETHYEAGRLIAQMHTVTAGLSLHRPTYSSEVLLDKSLDLIGRFLPAETEEMQFLIQTKPLLEQRLAAAGNVAVRSGIVHLDIWFDNLNITEDGQITLFDFDFCGNGWLCLDLAYYILQLYNIEKEETARTMKMNAFYQGYTSLQPISPEEQNLIPVLGVCLHYFYLGTQCQRFDNWSNTFINEVYLKRYTSVLIKGYWEFVNTFPPF